MEKISLEDLNHNYLFTSILFLICIFLSTKCPSKLLKSTFKDVLFIILKFLNKTRNLSLLPLWTVSAGQGLVPIPASINPKRTGISLSSLFGLSRQGRPHSLVS